ncbi:prolyl oligopeptidase family serine peptidase [Agromyces sp. CFH 90414]|uniref:Prolyl oligopeptidase family serine peptidase n=1 Tax=Agromyces agglutinans TaxID=2662258 RepID=A0A6I2FFW6_9MICO|nr:S9 family peptidase [Agromyces agglutinans]MRG59878.1 prolyl oligopeptidase family serine peptidase [Agromyces agglutinans]
MLTPPETPKRPTTREHHGDVVVDDYEWLREKEDPEVIAHLHAENAYTKARTEHLSLLTEQVFEEIKARTKETDLSVASREGDWWYFTRTVEGQQYGIHCRVAAAGPDDWDPPVTDAGAGALPGEQVLFDENAEAEGHEFFALGSFDVSADGSLLLTGVDVEGDERYTLRIRAVDGSGRAFADVIEGTAGGALFDPSGRYVFYTTVDEAWRPDTVWRHEVGTEASADVQVFTEPDERFWLGVGLTRSRRFLMIEAGSNVTSETWLLDASDPTGAFEVVWPRKEGVEYDVEHVVAGGRDRLLIVHNDDAVNFELVSVAASDPRGKRRVLLPHDEAVRLEGVDAFRDFVAVEYRREGLPRVAIAKVPPQGLPADATPDDTLHELGFDEALFAVGVGGNPAWEQPVLRVGYTSFVTPTTVIDVVVATGERIVRKQQPVLGDYDPARYAQRREWAIADDGTRVPISLVYREDLVERGTPAPTLLYGYGSYEHSIDPGFSIARLSLLDRGMVFAVAHVRGGGEMGRLWYEHGKQLHKRNTFTDFVAAARHLIDTDVTAPDRLVAQGGSAGGLLMGAVANLAPRHFSGILAEVPFVDPLTSILDPSLPLTVIEWDEWGNPLEDPEVYAYMKAYSPYENVHDGAHGSHYPPILAVTSLNDTRVLYVEPAKWVAKLREAGADALLRIEMAAGHGGVSGRYSAWRERAFAYAWVIDRAKAHPSGE